MNRNAANPGDVVKHLVLAELLYLERRRIATYVDTHSGRPWNELWRDEYAFTNPFRQPRAAWADGFMELATSAGQGRDFKNARYTKLLQQDHGAGAFWGRAGRSQAPVYPGSVGIALASSPNIDAWFCGECNAADQKQLRRWLPPRSVHKSLVSGPGRKRLARSLGSSAFAIVDPYNLNRPSEDAQCARAFVVDVAKQGVIVEAWYPLFRQETPAKVAEVWRSLSLALRLEVWWSQGRGGPSLKGAGVIVTNIGGRTAQHLTALVRALTPIYGRVEVCERGGVGS